MEKNNHEEDVGEPFIVAGAVAIDDNVRNENVEKPFDVLEAVKTLTVVVNKALQEIVDLKTFVVAQYSTHFEELQTVVAVNKSLNEISDLKDVVTARVEELTTTVRGQQSSLEVIHGSLKMIEVVLCTKPGNVNSVEKVMFTQPENTNSVDKQAEQSNPVITIEDDNNEDQSPTGSRAKRKAAHNGYDSDLDKEKELANTDLIFSDDDFEYDADDMNKRICQTVHNLNMQIKQNAGMPILPDAWTSQNNLGNTTNLANPMHFSNSNVKRVSKDGPKVHDISKKLFESPFTSPTSTTRGKRGCSSTTKGKKYMAGSSSSGAKRNRSVLPKGIKWNFPVTSDMKLDLQELQAIAYVYHPDKDKSKKLVKAKGIEASRSDFDTLRPGNMLNHKIMTLACLRAHWVQENYKRGSVWYLPPAFADDVFTGKTVEQLIDIYCKDWMPPYPNLKYIYVPISTATNHWFLMVISLQQQTIYHLDTYCGLGEVKPRRATISIISRVLEKMVTSGFYGTTFYCRALDFNQWEIQEAHGIPNCGHSNNAAVWVIDWIDMDQCFTPNIQGELQENLLRVRTAAILVLGLHNDMWSFIEEEAKTFWELIAN